MFYIKKYTSKTKYNINIKNHITALLENNFSNHKYYKSEIYKKKLVEEFIYYYKNEIINNKLNIDK